jgi:hypothetical protein
MIEPTAATANGLDLEGRIRELFLGAIDVVMADLEIDDFRTVKSIAAFVTRLCTGGGVR